MATASHKAIPLGTDAIFTIVTKDATGTIVDADSLPTVTFTQVEGANSTITATVAQAQDGVPANITGTYHVTVDTSGLALGDDVAVGISTAIGGVTTDAVSRGVIVSNFGGAPCIDA